MQYGLYKVGTCIKWEKNVFLIHTDSPSFSRHNYLLFKVLQWRAILVKYEPCQGYLQPEYITIIPLIVINLQPL